MSEKFDQLTKGLAQAVTRRQALRRFSIGLAGLGLALVGLPRSSQAQSQKGCALLGESCQHRPCCSSPDPRRWHYVCWYDGICRRVMGGP